MNSSLHYRSSIPFNRSSTSGDEVEHIQTAIESGQIAGDHDFSLKCQDFLEKRIGVGRSLLTTSCTHALEIAALLLEIEPGDEVIVPSFTFVSTVNAFVLRGATPVFCDSRADTFNMDENCLEGLVTSRTKAIVPVHYAGVACEMDSILNLAQGGGIAVVEDNAHGLFGRYRGRCLGTFGCLATQSFHETKNITCGEGGALLINDSAFIDRAEILREKGTNRSRFFRGQIDKYSWVDLGSSYVMSDILAAYLFSQLKRADHIQANRRRLWDRYHSELADWAGDCGIRQPVVPPHCEQAYHMYYLLMPTLEYRTAFISYLKERGISAVFHYLPLHLSEYATTHWGGKEGDCPVAEDVSDRIVRLPFYTSMTGEDQARVIEVVSEWRG
jgi:dTDP-4-amino-4,6-dideoxygalactose transaminase